MNTYLFSTTLILTILLLDRICCYRSEVYPKYAQFVVSNNTNLSEDGRLSFSGIALKYGYLAEQRAVITEDGYNLTLHHIPGDKSRIVLLVHGNTVDADCWIIRGETSLAITLAKLGYDVWAISLRGTTGSRTHVSIDADKEPERFFNFSFYEQGIHDLPDTIDYILKDTGQTQLLGVGYSTGTTVFYVMGAEKPEYNDKVKAVISLAPICYINHQRGLAKYSKNIGIIFLKLAKLFGLEELESTKEKGPTPNKFCLGSVGYAVCVIGNLFKIFGPDKEGLEKDFLPTLFGHFPKGCSRKNFEHLYQVALSGLFSKYNYGEKGNMEMYGSKEPPEFDLSKVTMKVALIVGKADFMSTIIDTERLRGRLPNVVYHQVLPYKQFNHLDFVWGKHMPDNLYPYVLPLIDKYS